MKRLILASILIGFLAPAAALAQASSQDFTPLAPIPGLTDQGGTGSVLSGDFATFFNSLYQYLIGLAVVLAIIYIIWGGLEISTKDSVSKHSNGVQRITNAVLGLVLILMPVLVFSIINPDILNLSVNFQALNLYTPPSQQPTQPTQQLPQPAGCSTNNSFCSSSSCTPVSDSCATYLQDFCRQIGGTPATSALNDPNTGTASYQVECKQLAATSTTTFASQADCQVYAASITGQTTYYWRPGTCQSNDSFTKSQPGNWTCTPGPAGHVCVYIPK
jgi:hypothetical protein